MLNRFELLWSLIIGGVVFFVGLRILKYIRKEKLPKGSILIEKIESDEALQSPGKRWSQIGVSLPLTLNMILEFIVIFLCIFDLWNAMSQIIAINFPAWVNWFGMIGLYSCIPLDLANFYYNVNFTRLYKQIEGKYVLATGGPYRYVRHPMYVGGVLEVMMFFITTGIYIILFYLIFLLLALPYQAKGEEKLLKAIFGDLYDEYISKTGRFFPKF